MSCYCVLISKMDSARALFEMKSPAQSQMCTLEAISSEFNRISKMKSSFFLPYSKEAIWSMVQLAYSDIPTTNESILEDQLQITATYSIPYLTEIMSVLDRNNVCFFDENYENRSI